MIIRGKVHGGQQPVSHSSIQMYTVGSVGNGSAAVPMLSQPAITDEQGNFRITGDYTCGLSSSSSRIASGSNQVYLVATGGNPGLPEGTDNRALVLITAIGDCSSLSDATYIEINEVTTVAAAWALAPFMISPTDVGASSTNVAGIQNAFHDASLLADSSAGVAATLPEGLTIETDKLYALADALASCVNSDGTAGCVALFTAAAPASGVRPGDTLTAALNIVQNPGRNVALVYKAIGGFPPVATGLKKAPNDWTMSLTVRGGGLDTPTSLAIDAESNVWVPGYGGPLSAFGPQGAPLSPKGFGAGSIAQVFAVAVDSVGDVWVTNFNGGSGKGSVSEFLGTDVATAGPLGSLVGSYSDAVFYPDALSADTNGDMFIANHDSSTATVYSSSGVLLYGGLGTGLGLNGTPRALAVDANHGFWLSGDDNTVAHISGPSPSAPYGELISNPTCCYESYGLATDVDGTVWVADFHGGAQHNGAFAEITSDAQGNTAVPIPGSTAGGINHPAFVVVDAGQNVWITNLRGASISEIAGSHTSVPAGTALSPTTGTYGKGGFGLDAALVDPIGIAPDRSGNIWVSNEGSSTVVMFFGLATPTATPVQPIPVAP